MNARLPLLALGASLWLQSCDTQIAGTNNETHSKGTFFQPDGQPAVGARVRVFQAADDSQPVRQTYVDRNGAALLTNLPRGYYSLLVQDTSGRAAFLDSLYSDGDVLSAPQDTVRSTAVLVGHVRVQPMHSPDIAWIHLMRTGIYANVDSTGAFRITGVPSGALTLVAATLLPEYTPTFRGIKTQPDSTLDVGTIDLVYNGLPLVTGIVATYDTLSGVVTVTWKDTAYARKNGYVVYRGQGQFPTPGSIGSTSQGSSLTNGIIGSTAASTYADTVFGGFGATPSRYDSAEMDLTYWVAARSNDYSTGPVWNKAQLHVKSPALAKRWSVEWAATIPLTGGVSVDTIAGGLAVIHDSVLDVRPIQGSWNRIPLHIPAEMEGGPVFWNGKLWMVRGLAVSQTLYDIWNLSGAPDTVDTWMVYDSVRILSSSDGINWDSTELATGRDSVTSFHLSLSATGLVLTYLYKRDYMGAGCRSMMLYAQETHDGGLWSGIAENRGFVSGFYDPTHPSRFESIQQDGFGAVWSRYSDSTATTTTSWIIPGESVDTSKSVLDIPWDVQIRASRSTLVFGGNRNLDLASPTSPATWQIIPTPEPALSFCFWQGKLVVLGASGIHIATIR